jgi:hypothetical protein
MYSHEDRMTGPEKSVSLLARVSDVLIHAWIADSSEIVEFCRIAENECISPETPPRLLFASPPPGIRTIRLHCKCRLDGA